MLDQLLPALLLPHRDPQALLLPLPLDLVPPPQADPLAVPPFRPPVPPAEPSTWMAPQCFSLLPSVVLVLCSVPLLSSNRRAMGRVSKYSIVL
jgi:hypothetical protein